MPSSPLLLSSQAVSSIRDPIWGLSLDPAPLHLAATLAFLVAVFYLPAHLALSRAFGRPRARAELGGV